MNGMHAIEGSRTRGSITFDRTWQVLQAVRSSLGNFDSSLDCRVEEAEVDVAALCAHPHLGLPLVADCLHVLVLALASRLHDEVEHAELFDERRLWWLTRGCRWLANHRNSRSDTLLIALTTTEF